MNSVFRLSRLLTVGAALFAVSIPALAGGTEALPDRIEFNKHIRPVLSNNCFLCHGPDKNKRKAGLRLDIRSEAVSEREGVRAVIPGDSTASELVKRITHADVDERMPPLASERKVTPFQIELLKKWIDQGAKYEPHWAYIKPVVAPMPKVKNESWVRNPVDGYILVNLEAQGLQPSPEADRVTLIRRLSFDLAGLPPTPAEVDGFVNDSAPDAYERVVDRLLASPHFGERMAIYWLDLVRYADTVGYHGDQLRGMSPYRDYVINAFNANMPFDQFTREQLAGDLIEDATLEQKLATGYNRLNMVTREGGAQDKDYLVRYAADRIRTTATVWLGSSLACAQCHDHKFDPFTTRDFYRFGAFFADIEEKGVQTNGTNEEPFPPLINFPTDEETARLARYDEDIKRSKVVLSIEAATRIGNRKGDHDKLARERKVFEENFLSSAITVPAEPRTMRVLPRGNWMDESGEIVTPAIPEFLGGMWMRGDRPTRLDLAAWLTDPDNPLTARVFMNRLWRMYFGTGISRTLDDVGSQGEWPRHPDLLDYLAVDFVDSGWDIKHAVKLLVTSSAYRQTSKPVSSLKELDPFNRLVARQSRFRLDAEVIRDNALKVSGLLVPAIGGRSVRPYQPALYYKELNFPIREYEVDKGENLYRRGVYTHWQRTYLQPSLLAFDAPSREECTAERVVSNTPQQALTLLNDPIYVEASRVFAERILREGGESVAAKIDWAYREAYSRKPLLSEGALLIELYGKHLREFSGDPEAAKAFIDIGENPAPDDMDPVLLASWSSVSRTLFNTHEMIYRY